HTAKLWDVETGFEILTLRGHRSSVWCLAFSPDGRLATASLDRSVRIWDGRPWTPASAREREAVGILDSLFAKPLTKDDVVAYLRSSSTIRPEVAQQALALVDRYLAETDPATYQQASWTIVRQPYLNAFQYRFALQQAQAACQLAPAKDIFRSAI